MSARREDARVFQNGQNSITPVLLREAVLDSVTFRATTKHFEDQVDAVDSWLTAFIKHSHDVAHQFSKLEDLALNLHGKVVPTFIESGIIDPDYTVTAMARCSEGNRAYWKSVFAQVKTSEQTLTEPLVKLQHNELKEIRHLANEFHRQQKSYDDILRYYCQQPKTKEASSLREDAFQLYEKRKAYIKASFDYTIKMSTFKAALDGALIAAFSETFEKTASTTASIATEFASRSSMSQIKAWSEEMRASSRSAEEHLYTLRFEMEDEINRLTSPPRDLGEYVSSPSKRPGRSASLVPNRPAKQGWLMMRAVTGKPARYIWYRKWCYVKGGIFAWLSNNPKTGAVEESDKYGVLLCNVKIPTIEDRRFCFEVLTKDSTILLQAESDSEVAEWLSVFDLSKKAIIASKDSNEHAFAVSKPISEFAAPALTLDTGHGELTDLSGMTPKKGHAKNDSGNHGLSALISASGLVGNLAAPGLFGRAEEQKYFNPFETQVDNDHLSPTTFAPAPMNTSLTKESLLNMTTSVVHAPSGTQANHWGSINYGMLSGNSNEGKGMTKLLAAPEAAVDQLYMSRDKDLLEKGIWDVAKHYPHDYPNELKRQDAQFSSIFPHARAEHVLMVIRGTREVTGYKSTFSGRLYVTLRGIYFYSQSCGLVIVQSCLFSEILSVHVRQYANHGELIFDIHDVGEARMTLYLDDVNLVCKRIESLLANYIADEPQGTHAMLSVLQNTLPDDTKVIPYDRSKPENESDNEDSSIEKKPAKVDAVRLKLPSEPVLSEPDEQGLAKIYDAEYMVTAKGLFHLLFGNRSPVWLMFYRNFLGHMNVQQLPWQTMEDGSLARAFRYANTIEGVASTFTRQDSQRIEKRSEHIDYVVTVYVRPWHLPNGANYFMQVKYNISFVSKTRSRLRVWVDMDWKEQNYFTRGVIAKAVIDSCTRASREITHLIEREVLDRLGLSSKTSKAVRIYGRVGGHSEPVTIDNKSDVVVVFKSVSIWQLIKKYPRTFILSAVSELWTLLRTVIEAAQNVVTANAIITVLLLLSVVGNIYLTGKSSIQYRRHRSAVKLLKNIKTSPVGLMSRHITIPELTELAYASTSNQTGPCFATFNHTAFRTPRARISERRNELLVAMGVLNGIETELIKGEWRTFLANERRNCQEMKSLAGINPALNVPHHCDDCLNLTNLVPL